jgi:hypothetical protein
LGSFFQTQGFLLKSLVFQMPGMRNIMSQNYLLIAGNQLMIQPIFLGIIADLLPLGQQPLGYAFAIPKKRTQHEPSLYSH